MSFWSPELKKEESRSSIVFGNGGGDINVNREKQILLFQLLIGEHATL